MSLGLEKFFYRLIGERSVKTPTKQYSKRQKSCTSQEVHAPLLILETKYLQFTNIFTTFVIQKWLKTKFKKQLVYRSTHVYVVRSFSVKNKFVAKYFSFRCRSTTGRIYLTAPIVSCMFRKN